jgi:septum formation protein
MMEPLENLKKYDVVLASNSPRRQELIGQLGLKCRTYVIKGIEEKYAEDTPIDDISLCISKVKADAYKQIITGNQLVITADTIVICDGEALGKPKDDDEAVEMLQKLSGKTHKVVTGVTITTKNRTSSFKVTTDVEFAEMSDEEIKYYVEKFHPTDKAGAYGIQEWIGCIGVKGINGSFYNVIGLPLQRLYTELKKY